MKKLKKIVSEFSSLSYIINQMSFSTSFGREYMLNSNFSKDAKTLNGEFDKIDNAIEIISCDNVLSKYKMTLSNFRDIKGTIEQLSKGMVLSEVDLFEVKYLAYYCEKLREIGGFKIDSLNEVFDALDPDSTGVVNFYIYDSYDIDLANLRRIYKEKSDENIFVEIKAIEERVREKLSGELKKRSKRLKKVMERVAEIDTLIAKSILIKKYSMCRPDVGVGYGQTRYEGIFNVMLQDLQAERGRKYQRTDIELEASPILITGANMSGKTITLKNVATSQYLVQFGFFAPAERACVSLVDDVLVSIGDGQNENKGLSSYAAEMLLMSDIVKKVEKNKKQDKKYLVLIDELARTTSPKEGAAIVDAVSMILKQNGVMSLITTHYGSLKTTCRCKRVKGFVGKLSGKGIKRDNISDFIDYSLEDADASDTKSSEALRIAEILKINKNLIEEIKKYIV